MATINFCNLSNRLRAGFLLQVLRKVGKGVLPKALKIDGFIFTSCSVHQPGSSLNFKQQVLLLSGHSIFLLLRGRLADSE